MRIQELPQSEEPKFCRVDSDTLPLIWPAFLEIVKHHPRGLLDVMSVEEILSAIQNGFYDLWVGIQDQEVQVAVLTALHRHAYSSPLFVIWGGGIGKAYWKLGVKTLNHYAQLIGATEIRVPGRRGVGRWAEKLGFAEHQVIYVKPIEQPSRKWSN